MKKRLFWLALAALLLLANVAMWSACPWPVNTRLSKANVARITAGDSREEVYSLLGGRGWTPSCGVGIPPGENPEFWEDAFCGVAVLFDDEGHVIRASYARNPDPAGDAWRHAKAWMGR